MLTYNPSIIAASVKVLEESATPDLQCTFSPGSFKGGQIGELEETPGRVAFRKKIYRTIDELQTDLDAWITEYNEHRPHQDRWCFGKTPMHTFLDALPLAKEKLMAA